MKYAIDCEFIDTPMCSHLISIAVVRSDGESVYYEFPYPDDQITPWLKENVVPHLKGNWSTRAEARVGILRLVADDPKPEFWCYYGAYDWYHLCRLFGGFMAMPIHWPHRYRELADIQQGIEPTNGPAHHALNDAKSQMDVMKKHGIVS